MFGKILNLLWQNCNVLGQPFNFVHGQILKNNIATLVTLAADQNLVQFAEKCFECESSFASLLIPL